jgi:hypothetical protein
MGMTKSFVGKVSLKEAVKCRSLKIIFMARESNTVSQQ